MENRVIIICYKEDFQVSDAFLTSRKHLGRDFEIVIINNASGKDEVRSMRCDDKVITIYDFKDNYGLKAYQMLPKSTNDGYTILLNPDCSISREYIAQLERSIRAGVADVIVPRLTCKGRTISPFRRYNIRFDFYIFAFCCVRNDFLERIDEIPDYFFVDGVDYFLSMEFRRLGAFITSLDIELEHDLSVLSNFASLSDFRKSLIIRSELALIEKLFGDSNYILFLKVSCLARMRLAFLLKRKGWL